MELDKFESCSAHFPSIREKMRGGPGAWSVLHEGRGEVREGDCETKMTTVTRA
jgi:hypothetical protein